MEAPKFRWNRQTLVEDIAKWCKDKQQHQITLQVHKDELKGNIVVRIFDQLENKWYTFLYSEHNLVMIGNAILDLSKMQQFDRIIKFDLYWSNCYEWMKVICYSDEFNSLIDVDGPTKDGIQTEEEYNIFCDMISRDKMIAVNLTVGDKLYDANYRYYTTDGKRGKWLVDKSKLINAIKSTNTLKTINVGGYREDSSDDAIEEVLKEALKLNFSVTSLCRYDEWTEGSREIEYDHYDDKYLKWWRLIKKRNEESHRFNRTLFGDENSKDDGAWNNNKCPYIIAGKVLKTLFPSIPSLCFDKKGDRCFCIKCHTKRKDKIIYKRGQPSKRYALPIGWVRFGLKTDDAKCLMNKVWSHWHVAFHGTRKEVIPQIFKGGLILLKPGDFTISGDQLAIRKGHIPKSYERFNQFTKKMETFDPNQIYVSPSIKYSGHGVYAKEFDVIHPEDKNRTLTVQCAFQLRIRPNSYQIGQETVGAAKNGKTYALDENFNNNELEWYTKENIGIVLHGLLFKIKENNISLKKTKTDKQIHHQNGQDDQKADD